MTPGLVAGSFLIMFGMGGGVPIPMRAGSGQGMNDVSRDQLFSLVQTQGTNRRGDRRDTRQDCRQEEGAVGIDKRDCRQDGRQQRANPSQPATNPPRSNNPSQPAR